MSGKESLYGECCVRETLELAEAEITRAIACREVKEEWTDTVLLKLLVTGIVAPVALRRNYRLCPRQQSSQTLLLQQQRDSWKLPDHLENHELGKKTKTKCYYSKSALPFHVLRFPPSVQSQR